MFTVWTKLLVIGTTELMTNFWTWDWPNLNIMMQCFSISPTKISNVKELLLFMLMNFCMGYPVILKKSQMKFTKSLLWVRIVIFHSNALELILIRIEFHLPSINKVRSLGLKKGVSRNERTNRKPWMNFSNHNSEQYVESLIGLQVNRVLIFHSKYVV